MTATWFRTSPGSHDELSVKSAVKYLYSGSYRYDRRTESNRRSRFSQLLLEHGEKALQDWAVIAFSNPLEPNFTACSNKSNEGGNTNQIHWEQAPMKIPRSDQHIKKRDSPSLKSKDQYPSAHMSKIEGRLHLCSGSLVFEPNEVSRGIVRCPFARMDTPPKEHPAESGFEAMCVEFHSRRHFVMKTNNIIGAFQNVAALCRFQFTFLHSSPTAFVGLCEQLFTMARENARPPHAHPGLEALLKPMLDRPFDRNNFVDIREQAVTPNIRCFILSPLQSQAGALVLSSERVYFQHALGVLSGTETRADSWLQRNAVATARRYNGLRDSALEIYWKDETSTLFAFERRHDRELVLRSLTNPLTCVTDRDFLIDVVKCWQKGELSNFEYLLAVNSAAGRSFHDLSRYPVFPWVISDYTSSKLDLNNPATFRDLRKPMGALNKDRLDYFLSRLKSMRETSMDEAFLYGTHYSAPGYVLYFLVRSMPEHMLCLQNGKFDAPDRMFHSIAQCYSCALTNQADVKELTPEFYDPNLDFDFLINVKGLQLGATQNGERVNDVKLPPWARSPRDYVKKNRNALESVICTNMLPQWLDLIFGCRSRGDESMEAHNVFHPNAYLGPTDIASMQTEEERFQAELQATEFGIVPDKLFCEAHPSRNGTFDESCIADDVGRASSKDENGREAWELLDSPGNNILPQTTSGPPGASEQTWDNAHSLKTIVDSRSSANRSVALRGTGQGTDHHGSFSVSTGNNATPLRLSQAKAEETDIPVVTSTLEDSADWEMKVLERKQIHTDAVSGCALFLNQGEIGLSILVTSSLDGGLTVHRVSLEETQEALEPQKIGFTSTLSRFSYGNIININRNLAPVPAPTRLSEYRSHTSRDPLASLAITCDGAGGSIAFAGGHDDVVLAYGIKSACAVASVYSHRDAVTGLDLVERTPFDPDCAIWLDNSTHIMVSGSWDATVKVWSASVAAGETVAINREPIAELFDADASIVSVGVKKLSSGGIVIAAGCQDGSFCVWNIHNDGVQVQIHNEPAKKGSGPCSVVKWASERGAIHLYTAFSTGKLVSYTLSEGSLVRESAVSVGMAVSAMVYMTGASALLLGCADGGLRLVPLRDATNFEAKPTLWKAVNNKRTSPGISTISVSEVTTSDGEKTICCTGAEDGSVALFELNRSGETND